MRSAKRLYRNPFVYLTVVLVFIAAFELVNLVRAGYIGPTTTPPGGEPATPLDTSSVLQFKEGNLVVGTSSTAKGVSLNNNGIIYFGSVGSNGSFTPQGGISFDPVNHKMQYATSTSWAWTDFGTGSGSGISGIYDVDAHGGVPFIVQGAGNIGGILIKGTSASQRYSPLLSWDSGAQIFSARAENSTLSFGIGNESAFTPLLTMDKNGNFSIQGVAVAPPASNPTWTVQGTYGQDQPPYDAQGNPIRQLSCDKGSQDQECSRISHFNGNYPGGTVPIPGDFGYDAYTQRTTTSFCSNDPQSGDPTCPANSHVWYDVYRFYRDTTTEASASWHLVGSTDSFPPPTGNTKRLSCDKVSDKADCPSTSSEMNGMLFFDGTSPGSTYNFGSDAYQSYICIDPYTCVSPIPLYGVYRYGTNTPPPPATAPASLTIHGTLEVIGTSTVNGQPIVPPGTWCGYYNGSGTVFSCNGYNVQNGCPPGWRQGIVSNKNEQICVKE